MNVAVSPQIIIRHVSGSKANQIELIPLADTNEITIGREASAKIAFTASGDDIVSRKHAAIKVTATDPMSFRIIDLGSSNGTFVNGTKSQAKQSCRWKIPYNWERMALNLRSIFSRVRRICKHGPAFLTSRRPTRRGS